MSNILLIHESEQPTLLDLFRALSRFAYIYDCNVKKQNSLKIKLDEFNWADIIICVRGESPATYALLKEANKYNKFLIYFLDDDLKDLPRKSYRFPLRRKWLLRCIKECSMLLTPNKLIGEEYYCYVKQNRFVVINTAVNSAEVIEQVNDNENVIKIVYAASQWHVSDFDAYIKPILYNLFEKYKSKICLYFIGVHPELDIPEYKDQIKFIDSMPLEKYNLYMASNHFDIGLAPLISNHFSERKYFNKYIEYAKVGICGIYSNVMPYRLIIKDGWNGLYASETPNDWFESIERAIEDNKLRREIITNSQSQLRTDFNENTIFEKLINDIPELLTMEKCLRSKKFTISLSVIRLRHRFFRLFEIIYLTCYLLKNQGIKITLKKIRSKARGNK